MAVEIRGVFLPIITPFLDGEVDLESYRRLLANYLEKGINGLIASPEHRLPMAPISDSLKSVLDALLAAGSI